MANIEDHPEMDTESIWHGYEGGLPKAIQSIIENPSNLPAEVWVRTLVPFATAVLVRSPEFRTRYQLRVPWTSEIPDFDSEGNAARVMFMELQRLLSQIMVADWCLLRPGGVEQFILNDQGWFTARIDGVNLPGIVVPLSPLAALQITPCFERVIAVSNGFRWIAAGIRERIVADDEMVELLQCTAKWATAEIYGSDAAHLKRFGPDLSGKRWISDLKYLGFVTGRTRVATEFDWHRMAILVKSFPSSPPFIPPAIPWELLESVPFQPPLCLSVDAPNALWSGLHLLKSQIRLRLFVEASMVAPTLSSRDFFKWATLLDLLARKHGPVGLQLAEDEFYSLPAAPDRPRDSGSSPLEHGRKKANGADG
jgi:hypothetical protein